uniref:Retrotransposon gag domain-containing protein n=1 Tax=Magallana gigas TaxID=29159 RepID=A0A8W8LKM7_MAGGI
MPTAANRKPVTRLQARTQLTFTEPSTVDPTQEQEQPASDIEDSDSEVTLRLPEPTFEQPSPINHPTATPARQSGMESFIKYYGTFDGSDDNAAYEFLIDLEHYAKAHKLKDEDVVLGFPTLLRGNAKRWFIHSEIDKTNIKTITDAFKSRFLNPSKCSTATLFQQKQRVGENVQDYITSMRATAARLGTPDRQVLEAIMDGFLPEIREKVIMKDPRTLEDLESAAVLSETARSNPAFRTDSSNTCQAGNSKSELQTLVQAMSELIKTQNYSIQAIQSQGVRNFNQSNMFNLVLFYLWLTVTVTEADQGVNRINYGVIFEQHGKFTPIQNWKHTFYLPLPNLIVQGKPNTNITNPQFAKSVNTIYDIHLDSLKRIATSISNIKQLLPEHGAPKPSRRKRSFLPFFGELSKTLFGTATVDDVNNLKRSIQRIQRQNNLMTTAFEHQMEHFSSFLTSADQRLNNAFEAVESAVLMYLKYESEDQRPIDLMKWSSMRTLAAEVAAHMRKE